WSNRRRGWRRFGWIASTGSWARSTSAAPPSSTSKPRPRPRRETGSGALDKLHRHLPVGLGARGRAVVRDRRQPVARRLGQPHGARHSGLEHELSEVLSYLLLDLSRH